MEKMGFDLCGACYNAPFKIPGRFNQQHKPEHVLELVPPPIIHMQMLAYESDEDGAEFQDNLDNIPAAPIPQDPENGPNNVQNVYPAFVMSVDNLDPDDDSDGGASPDVIQECEGTNQPRN